MIEAARSGNPFAERPLLIARLDHLSRNEDSRPSSQATDWDLVIVDEAHKMSAHYIGGEVKETKRYKLGRLAGSAAAPLPPHDGHAPRGHRGGLPAVPGAARRRPVRGKAAATASHAIDTSDLMRRLVKEKLLKFDGTPLFPERRAYTADLSALRRRGLALQAGDRVRRRGDEPRRAAQGGR